jgi:NADH:ubiquinone oxidoreductase subunit K
MTIFSILLFSLGTIILMIKNNFIYFLLGLELMLLSINLIVLQIAIDAHSFELIFITISYNYTFISVSRGGICNRVIDNCFNI